MPVNPTLWTTLILGLTINLIAVFFLVSTPKQPLVSAQKKPVNQQKTKSASAISTLNTAQSRSTLEGREKNLNRQIRQLLKPNNPWQAVISNNNTIRLNYLPNDFNKNYLPNKNLQSRLKNTITPVMMLLSQPHIIQYIKGLSLTVHTSSKWQGVNDKSKRLALNKTLPQLHARGLYRYLLTIPKLAPLHDWMRNEIQVFGHSFNKPILTAEGTVDEKRSSRIELIVLVK